MQWAPWRRRVAWGAPGTSPGLPARRISTPSSLYFKFGLFPGHDPRPLAHLHGDSLSLYCQVPLFAGPGTMTGLPVRPPAACLAVPPNAVH